MIVHTYALTAPVSPSAVWRHWVDVDQWTDHFPGLASARLNGPVAIGAVGLIKPDRGPRWSFRISAVDRVKKRFAIERKVLFGVVRLEFALERPEEAEEAEDAAAFDPPLPASPDAWSMVYTVTITGPLAVVYDRFAGRPIAKQSPDLSTSVAAASPIDD